MNAMNAYALPVIALAGAVAVVAAQTPAGRAVRIAPDAGKQQYVVTIGGQHFTTYCYGDAFLDKPVFYPVLESQRRPREPRVPDGREGAG